MSGAITMSDSHPWGLSSEIACGWSRCYLNRYCCVSDLDFSFVFFSLSLSFFLSFSPTSDHSTLYSATYLIIESESIFIYWRLPWNGRWHAVVRSIKLIDSSNTSFAAQSGIIAITSSIDFVLCKNTLYIFYYVTIARWQCYFIDSYNFCVNEK